MQPDPSVTPSQLIGASRGLRRTIFTRIPRFDDDRRPGALYEAGKEDLSSGQMARASLRPQRVPEARAWHHFSPDRLHREAWLRYANRGGLSVPCLE